MVLTSFSLIHIDKEPYKRNLKHTRFLSDKYLSVGKDTPDNFKTTLLSDTVAGRKFCDFMVFRKNREIKFAQNQVFFRQRRKLIH